MPDVLFELPPGNFGDGAPARRHPVVHDDRQAVLAQSDIRFDAIDAAILDSVSSSGWGNSVYGAVTPAEHRVCMELGLAGLITDHPSLVREARA